MDTLVTVLSAKISMNVLLKLTTVTKTLIVLISQDHFHAHVQQVTGVLEAVALILTNVVITIGTTVLVMPFVPILLDPISVPVLMEWVVLVLKVMNVHLNFSVVHHSMLRATYKTVPVIP